METALPEPNPTTALTLAEIETILWLDTTSSRETVLAELKANLQTAVEIELATIPIYLCAYYSLVRTAETGEDIGPAQLYANKAAGIIMSVAVEEMLHLSLASNILFSLGVAPQLYRRAPERYPTGLPYHCPEGPRGPDGRTAVQIPLAKLSFEQLWHFLQIEYPEKRGTPPAPENRNWTTIGQFYSYIRCLMQTVFITDGDFQHGPADHGIQPGNYSPNNIDTIYPSAPFDKWKPALPAEQRPAWANADPHPSAAEVAKFPDSGDSHAGLSELLTISSRQDAVDAIDTICDQGEGYALPRDGPSEDDDPSDQENSHYWKFMTLQAQFRDYVKTTESLPPDMPRLAPVAPAVTQHELESAGMIIDFPDNPTTGSYPIHLWPISAFCNACFQYMLILTETVYRVPAKSQKRFFNEGMHRAMIWVLDGYIWSMRYIPVGGGKFMAPTFENVDLGPRASSFAALKEYGRQAIAAANAVIDADPQGPLAAIMATLIGCVRQATEMTGSDGSPMHLPDVAPYWNGAEA